MAWSGWRRLVLGAGLVGLVCSGLPGSPIPAASAVAAGPKVVAPGALPSPPLRSLLPEVPSGDFSARPEAGRSLGIADDGVLPVGLGAEERRVVSRTESATVLDNGDGTSTAEIYASPMNFKDRAGVWRAHDPRLVPRDGGWENAAGPVKVRVAEESRSEGLVSVEGDGWSVGVGVDAVSAGRRADVFGSRARYRGAAAGFDVETIVGVGSVATNLVLPRLPAGAPASGELSWGFPLVLSGVTARVSAGEGVVLSRPDGAVVARMPTGVAFDSAGSDRTGARAEVGLSVRLEQSGGRGARVVYSLPAAWLADRARVWPVTVDPDVVFDAGISSVRSDAFVDSGAVNTNYNGNAQIDANAYVDKVVDITPSGGRLVMTLDGTAVPTRGVGRR